MAKKIKTIAGTDGYEYPVTSYELVVDENGESIKDKLAQLSGGSGGGVDLSGYVTKETGNANQITFSDGQTFQYKLDTGAFKGDTGAQGPQGERGATGERGADGLTTAVSVNGTTYTHSNGTITLPNYPTVISSASGINITDTANNFTATNVEEALAELFQSVSSGKSALASAITDKGVSTLATATFQQMATNISNISTGEVNVGDTLTTSLKGQVELGRYREQIVALPLENFANAFNGVSIWQNFGDSISSNYEISESQAWHNLIGAEYTSITRYNNALTGSEISDGGRNIASFVERYTNLNSNANLLTVFGGVNDWSHNLIPLGSYDDTAANQPSFYGALNTLIPGLKNQCPNARIVWILPLRVGSNAFSDYISNGLNSYGLTLQDYRQAIKNKCIQYGIDFVDLWNAEGLNPDVDTANFQSDGVHPTAAGQVVIKDYLLNSGMLRRCDATEYAPPSSGGGGGETPEQPETPSTGHVTEGLSLYLDAANPSNTTTVLADMSGNGNDFTCNDTITLNDANRVTLNGIYFSNTSYQPHTTTGNDFTFEFFGDITSTGARNYFFSYGSRNGFSWDEQQGLSGQMGDGDVIWPGTDTVNGRPNRIAPTFGEKHVIITKNGTTYSIYVDGALVQSVEYTTSWSASYTNFRLFVRYNGSNQLRGAMKYVRWYTRGFGASEVTQNYNSRNS